MEQWHSLYILLHSYDIVLSETLRETTNGGSGKCVSGYNSNADDVDRPLQIIFLRILRLLIQVFHVF